MRACLHCGQPVSAGRGFYELIRQPGGAAAGQFYTLCSDPCLAAFVRGGEPEPEPEQPEAERPGPRRGRCRYCSRRFSLTRAGKVRAHNMHNSGMRCGGSGQVPA